MLFFHVCLQRGLLLVLFVVLNFLSPDSNGNLVSRVLSLSRGKKENPGDEVAPTESLILTLILTFIFGKGGGGVLLPKQSLGLLALK